MALRCDRLQTFGGNLTSFAAGRAVPKAIGQENLTQHALDLGRYLVDGFRALAVQYTLIDDIRNTSLHTGIGLVDDRQTTTSAGAMGRDIVDAPRDRGLLSITTGPDCNILKSRGPMRIDRNEAGDALAAVG